MQELAGAVDRIDQDEGTPAARFFTPRGGLLGDHGDARQAHGEPGEDDRLGPLVGVADHASIGLLPGVMVARIDVHHGHRRLDGQFGEDLGDLVAIDRVQHGLGGRRARGRHHLVHSTQQRKSLRSLEEGCKMGSFSPQSIHRGVSPKTRRLRS